MSFDINKFKKNIERFSVKEAVKEDHSGFVNVIRYMTNFNPIYEVDFDSFSYEDVLLAVEAMDMIIMDDLDDETFLLDPANPFLQYWRLDDAIFALATSKNKSYELETDEEIFI